MRMEVGISPVSPHFSHESLACGLLHFLCPFNHVSCHNFSNTPRCSCENTPELKAAHFGQQGSSGRAEALCKLVAGLNDVHAVWALRCKEGEVEPMAVAICTRKQIIASPQKAHAIQVSGGVAPSPWPPFRADIVRSTLRVRRGPARFRA